jgi:erythromycin esterase-like protein
MAENLLWLAERRHAGRKIVVWAATSHASRRRDLIQAAELAPSTVAYRGSGFRKSASQ